MIGTINLDYRSLTHHFENGVWIYNDDVLKEMGMADAFDGGKADFTGLGTSDRGNIYIGRVIHKTYIEMSPKGTKAGAATVVEMMDECAPWYEEMRTVHLDRPFIYMLIDCENNQPFFRLVVLLYAAVSNIFSMKMP